jgi:hypothetical protein
MAAVFMDCNQGFFYGSSVWKGLPAATVTMDVYQPRQNVTLPFAGFP